MDVLAAGRGSFERRSWREAYEALSAADRTSPLALDDLERLAVAAFLVGEEDVCARVTERAHHQCVHEGDAPRAARCAFWIAFGLLLRGEMAPAGGWAARAGQLLDDGHHDCVERGFLIVPVAVGHLFAGELADARALFAEALAIGERFADADLVTFGRMGIGQALTFGGRHCEGALQFDLLMVAITSGEVSPIVAGLAYCAVIETCQLALDLRRAAEWTAALSRWCETQPELVSYRGQCLVHRAEILQLHGDWAQATEEAEQARNRLAGPPVHPAIGSAWYRLAELQRLRGAFDRAEHAYRTASEHGCDPQPGLALLRLAQGRPAVAASAIRRAFGEAGDRASRARLLLAHTEILLAADDVGAARAATHDLLVDDAEDDPPALRATLATAAGLVDLAEGDPGAALGRLRSAWTTWRDLDAPYEAACVRVVAGIACRQIGDEDGAVMELESAATVFRQLGAVVDLAAVEQLLHPRAGGRDGLSPRELQVLALVATGITNRSIAAELVVSDKTVARHVANIFTKLGVSSRSAATAYAYEHGLVRRSYTE